MILEILRFTEIMQYYTCAVRLAWFCIATITRVIQAEKPHALKVNHLLCLSRIRVILVWAVLQNNSQLFIYLFTLKDLGRGALSRYTWENPENTVRWAGRVLGYYTLLCTDVLCCLWSWSCWPGVPLCICEYPFPVSEQFSLPCTLMFESIQWEGGISPFKSQWGLWGHCRKSRLRGILVVLGPLSPSAFELLWSPAKSHCQAPALYFQCQLPWNCEICT